MNIHIYAYMRSRVCVYTKKNEKSFFLFTRIFAHTLYKNLFFFNVIPRMRYFHKSRNRKKTSFFTLKRLQCR